MRILQSAADWVSKAAMALAAIILIYAVCHILLETILRSIFATSTHVLSEFIGFAVMSITFLSLSWTLRSGAMIRVSLVIDRLPTLVFRVLEAISALVGFLLVSGLCSFLFRNMAKDWSRGAVSTSIAEVPLWIPGLIALVGATLLAIQLLLRALSAVLGTFSRKYAAEEAL